MRKHFKTFIFTALACAFLAGAGISAEAASKVAINDDNFSATLIDIAQEADKNGDGYLSKKEAANVTELSFNSSEKNDLFKGLEYFSNIKDFDFTADIDWREEDNLDTIKNDTSIQHRLNLSNYKKLENVTIFCKTLYLKEINLKGCSNLKNINISCRGNIDTLNLKGCNNLQSFSCMNTSVKKIDLSNRKKLMRVAITIFSDKDEDAGYIKTLNLKNCSNLTYVGCSGVRKLKLKGADKLQQVNCNNSKFTSLDLRNKKALQTVKCYDNPNLTQLDVSGCRNLRNIHCYNTGLKKINVKQNANLVRLRCNNTAIKKLNLKKNKKLRLLDCRDTNIRSLNLPKTLKGKAKVKCSRGIPVTYNIK